MWRDWEGDWRGVDIVMKITRKQVIQLLSVLGFEPPSPELLPVWQRFAQAAIATWGYPQWHPIDTAPSNGKFFLAVNISDPCNMMIVNWPAGCDPGRWYYDEKLREWFGSAYISKKWVGPSKSDDSRQQDSFTHWAELPNPPSSTEDNSEVVP